MSDAISRNEALRRIENFMYVSGGNAAVQMCYEIIQHTPVADTSSDWVSVEERLPEEYDKGYLCVLDTPTGRVVCTCIWLCTGQWLGTFDATVTHWMELPNLPNE